MPRPGTEVLSLEQDRIVDLVRRAGVREDDRAEIVQETWLELLKRDAGRRRRVGGMLRLVVLHAAMRWRVREHSRRQREERVARADRQPSVLDELAERSARCELRRLVGALAEPYRTVVGLRYLEGLTAREIGLRLERRADTVRVQLKRGLDLLRDRMAGDHGPGGAR